MRQLVILCPQTGSRERERDAVRLLISSLFSLSLVSDLDPWDGVVHIEGESSLLS